MDRERKIYLLRHGEICGASGERRCLGRTDVPLAEMGLRQAARIAQWFEDKEIERIYASPLHRCAETARIIADHLAETRKDQRIGTTEIREDLCEMRTGEWENLTFREIRERYPQEYERRGRQIGTYAPPGGESFCEAGRRFGRCVDAIRRESAGNILIVSHAGVMRGYLCSFLKMAPDEVLAIPQPYAGVSVLREACGRLFAEQTGQRPEELLDGEEISRLYERCGTPPHVIRHMQAVAAYLDGLKTLSDAGKADAFHWKRLEQAALLHDICRTEKDHARAGARFLRKEGYEKIAELVEGHHDSEISGGAASDGKISGEAASGGKIDGGTASGGTDGLSEAELLFYADKRVREDRVVSVEDRFKSSLAKCRTPEAREKHRKLYEKTKRIEKKIEGLTGGYTG